MKLKKSEEAFIDSLALLCIERGLRDKKSMIALTRTAKELYLYLFFAVSAYSKIKAKK